MLMRRLKSGPFHRIGNQYGHLFDNSHFLGRSAFEGNWLTKDKKYVAKSKRPLAVDLPSFYKKGSFTAAK